MATQEEIENMMRIEALRVAADRNQIIEVGQAHYGTETFDRASQVVGETLGPEKVTAFMALARHLDKPHDVIVSLANKSEADLKEFAALTPERQLMELSRIESRMTSFGHTRTGADPEWKRPEARTGRVSDDEWRRTGGDTIKDDAAWNREYNRRMEKRDVRR